MCYQIQKYFISVIYFSDMEQCFRPAKTNSLKIKKSSHIKKNRIKYDIFNKYFRLLCKLVQAVGTKQIATTTTTDIIPKFSDSCSYMVQLGSRTFLSRSHKNSGNKSFLKNKQPCMFGLYFSKKKTLLLLDPLKKSNFMICNF